MTTPDRVESTIKATCSKCGHSSTLFVSDATALDGLKKAMSVKSTAALMKIFWKGWAMAFVLGLCVGWFAWLFWRWI